ncbi:MAG: hypothetical protein VW270_08140 [Candidatus Poseidoniales archaeon]
MMPLKPVDKKENPGLAKLPTDVRNKMGYMKDGGMTDDMPARLKDGRAMLTDYLDKDARERGMKDKDAAEVNLKVVKAKQEIRKEKNKKKRPTKKAKGGMVLEIGLRPATKQEMKMAKKMKKPMKKAGGGMVRGTGAAITGKGFKGVF